MPESEKARGAAKGGPAFLGAAVLAVTDSPRQLAFGLWSETISACHGSAHEM